MPTELTKDRVRLEIAIEEDMAQVLRLATTSLASHVGLNLDQADDLNTALEEIFRYEISENAHRGLILSVSYIVSSAGLEISAVGTSLDLADESKKVNRYSRFVIESVTDDFSDSPNPEGGFDIRMVKTVSR